MTDSKIIDSSIWIEYFSNKKYSEVIESKELLYVSTLSLFEIKKKLLKEKINQSVISEIITFIKKRAITIPVEEIIAEKAAEISINHKLHTADAIIYTTAILNNSILITGDNDFRGLKNAIIIDK